MVTTASTSNVGVALAGLAAETGQSVVIFVPVSVPGAKLAQMQVYGATVIEVDGSYHDAFELSMHAVERLAWYNCNTGINPYVGEGKKTVALEIVEQLGWEAPDAVFVSVGDGSIIGGVHKGFRDAVALGWIDRMPRLYGVQAAGSAYLADAWANGEDVVKKPRIRAETEAHSISADLPLDRVKAMAAVSDSGGAWVTVEDHDILDMIPEVATRAGVFSEARCRGGLRRAGQGHGQRVGCEPRRRGDRPGGGHLHRIGLEGHRRRHVRHRPDKLTAAVRRPGSGGAGVGREIPDLGPGPLRRMHTVIDLTTRPDLHDYRYRQLDNDIHR